MSIVELDPIVSTPPAAFTAPGAWGVPGTPPRRACVERAMSSWDGTELFYRAWLPPLAAGDGTAGDAAASHAAGRPGGRALVLFHRGHEHSGRYQSFIDDLGLDDWPVFAWDARGHGRSPGERGDAPSFAALVRDVDAFVRHLCREFGLRPENLVALGHSVGAVAVAAWVHDYAPPIRAMVLVTPAFRVKLYVPLARAALRLRMAFGGRSFVKSYVKAGLLTHDPQQARAYRDDPLISRAISTRILLELHDASTRLLADAGAIDTPALILSAGSDWVVTNSAQRRFFDRLSSPWKEREEYPGFRHAILHEADRNRPIGRIRRFLIGAFERPPATPALSDADRVGYTRREYDRLARPLPWYCPFGLRWRLQKWVLKTAGRLSDGIRLGWRHGFDSGESLDYVYRNRSDGITPLGRLTDRLYLNAVGWRGIRLRKAHLRQLLDRAVVEAVGRPQSVGRPVRVVDIASGPGRYLLEAMRDYVQARGPAGGPASASAAASPGVTALLRDRSPGALKAGRRLASELGVAGVTFAEADAFDADSLAAMTPRPDVAIVSGLYELFPDNGLVRRSLAGLARALPEGGALIYTNQPWHPQVEMIARVLVNREGRPWVMRRRTQAEMDQLVAGAGFEKIDTLIDPFGIFTVSLARRRA